MNETKRTMTHKPNQLPGSSRRLFLKTAALGACGAGTATQAFAADRAPATTLGAKMKVAAPGNQRLSLQQLQKWESLQ